MQRFTIESATTFRSLSYTALELPETLPYEVKYTFYSLNGAFWPFPWEEIAGGTGQIASQHFYGPGQGALIIKTYVDIEPVDLDAGTYFLGFQIVSYDWAAPYILEGAGDGAFDLHHSDGGSNSTFFGLRALAVGAYDTAQGVPEPASWAMMVAGFGLAGAAMRRRKLAVRFS
jgi:hypothetical protein